jgi:hypothetical protein
VTELLLIASLLTAAAAVVVGAAVWLATRRLQVALPVTLDLLMATGLLRLSSENTWQAIGTAAAVIALRKVVQLSLRRTPSPGRLS